MDPMTPQSGPNKPVAGMIIVLFTSLFVGGWLYVDSVRTEMETRMDGLEAEIRTAQASARAIGRKPPAFAPESGTTTDLE